MGRVDSVVFWIWSEYLVLGNNWGSGESAEISVLLCTGTDLLGHVRCDSGIVNGVGNCRVEVRL